MIPDHVCGNCRFWELVDEEDKDHAGICHRYPPVITNPPIYEAIGVDWLFPVTADIDWCGEWALADA